MQEKVEATTGTAAGVRTAPIPSSYLTFGDERSDSERKEIWDNGERLLNWTFALLQLRESEALQDWQVVLQQQKEVTPKSHLEKYAAMINRQFYLGEFLARHPEMRHTTEMLLAYWPIEPLTSAVEVKIKYRDPMFERSRGKPRGSEFAQAYADAKFIKQQWRRVFQHERRGRDDQSTAYDVAAAYHGVDADQLFNYERNRNRKSRRKAVR
jgi:hypothetical protein